MQPITVSAFYKFVPLPRFAELREPLRALCAGHGVKGTILLAAEGINGTVAGSPEGMAAVMAGIRSIAKFGDHEFQESFAEAMPFLRLKVRLKKEIVTLGVAGIDPNRQVGRYVPPADWNSLISDPEVLVIDTRNGFEVAAGTFAGAIDPGTKSFGEFPDFVSRHLARHKARRIAMFCTGGIRCEKATSFLLHQGFADVCHLQGGILNYLASVPREKSLWQGSCFVFDERQGLEHGLEISGAAGGSSKI